MRKVFLWSILLLIIPPPFSAIPPESTNYRMNRLTATAGAVSTSSSSWDNAVLIAQEGPSGVASFCGQGAIASLGFWSVLGDIPMPIQLDVRQNMADPDDLNLMWTGNASTFQVYRAIEPENLLDPANLFTETPDCFFIDLNAVESKTLFYKVMPKP